MGSTQTGRAVEEAERGDLTSAVSPLLSVVIPCLNEADTVGPCIDAAINAMRAAGVTGEVHYVDAGYSVIGVPSIEEVNAAAAPATP